MIFDYYGRQGIVVEKRPKKITVTNPGIFRPDKEEVFEGGISDPRNPNIFKIFALIDIGERAGSGLFNICTVWQDMAWSAPVWEEKFEPERLMLSIPIETEEEGTETVEEGTEKEKKGTETIKKGTEKEKKGTEKGDRNYK